MLSFFLFGCDPRAEGKVFLDSEKKDAYIAQLNLVNTIETDNIYFHVLFINNCIQECQNDKIYLGNPNNYYLFENVGIWGKKGETNTTFKITFDKERKDEKGKTLYPYSYLKSWIKGKENIKIYLIANFSNCKIVYKESEETNTIGWIENKDERRSQKERPTEGVNLNFSIENEKNKRESQVDDPCPSSGGILREGWRKTGKKYIKRSNIIHEFNDVEEFKTVYNL